MSADLQKCKDMRAALMAGNLTKASQILAEIKNIIMNFESLPPLNNETPNAEAERVVARTMYEYAVILAVRENDQYAFQRYVSSLRPYYSGYGPAVSESELKNEIIGLNLLFLIVENRMADFHSELELLTDAQRSQPAVEFCSKLDRLLMVGSYDQVLSAATHPPCESFSFLLLKLAITVRTNIGECAAAAYKTLSVSAASDILMFSTKEETLQFIAENYPHWVVNGNTIDLCSVRTNKSEEIPSQKIISQTLKYASELERIV